jgi:inositol oxygenase
MFRNYPTDQLDPIAKHYQGVYTNQTVEYVQKAREKYCTHFPLTLNFWDALDTLAGFIDVSDPDINLPNKQHLFQTAEAIRADGHPEWLQFTGLIHDLGKILYLRGCDQDGTSVAQQWGIVGDTFVLGHPIPESIVYSQFIPDTLKNVQSIYQPEVGLESCWVSFGHDEYLYWVLKNHPQCTLPPEALYTIRFHSMYPYHKGGAYKKLLNNTDRDFLPWVQLFNKYDLYSKSDIPFDTETEVQLKEYYSELAKKFLGLDLKISF